MSIFGPLLDRVVVTKAYVDQAAKHEHGLNVQAIGRYIVWYDEAEEKHIYYSVRAKKNVDLESGKLIEMKNGNRNEEEITHTRLESSKELYVMLFNYAVNIPIASIGNEWSFILSYNPFTDLRNNLIVLSLHSKDNITRYIHLSSSLNKSKIIFKYGIIKSDNTSLTPLMETFYPINPKQLIHISVVCATKTITLRVNGKPWRDYKPNRNHELRNVTISFPTQIGILSIYNRQLSKPELIQHFIDYHVPNFTDDEVLI